MALLNLLTNSKCSYIWGICLSAIMLSSCEKLEPDTAGMFNSLTEQDAKYEEMSAGMSTIFSSTRYAYDTNSSWIEGDLMKRFLNGDAIYDTNRVADKDDDFGFGGLGPLNVGYSCGSCHNNTGATGTTLWSNGGSGELRSGFSSILIFITTKDGRYIRNYGRVLHDQTNGIYGIEAEGRLKVDYDFKTYKFHDGEEYELATPKYRIEEWYAEEYAPEDLVISVRTPMRHVGMGQMMSLDEQQLLRLAKQSNYPEYGISGRLNYVTERGKYQIGVSGRKAQHVDLTVELGFSSDMGVTNDRYPEEVCQGQDQYYQYHPTGNHGIEISTEDMEDVDLYMHSVGVPARRNVDDPNVKNGEAKFYEAKCNLCHIPTLTTKTSPTTLINGTQLPWLNGQVIHPYSDYLLHDMGPEMDDGYPSGLAKGSEWRTTPLWGIGLLKQVNGHTEMMHDGRARNFVEAIMWHYGEGAVSKELFARMSKEDRDDLVTFLKSL